MGLRWRVTNTPVQGAEGIDGATVLRDYGQNAWAQVQEYFETNAMKADSDLPINKAAPTDVLGEEISSVKEYVAATYGRRSPHILGRLDTRTMRALDELVAAYNTERKEFGAGTRTADALRLYMHVLELTGE